MSEPIGTEIINGIEYNIYDDTNFDVNELHLCSICDSIIKEKEPFEYHTIDGIKSYHHIECDNRLKTGSM